MLRRLAPALAVLSVTLLAGAAPPKGHPAAGSAQKPPDVKAMMERTKRCMRELSAHASKVSFDRKDLERFLAEWRSFDALGLDETPDADDTDGPDCVDVSAAVAEPKYVAWARQRRLDPKTWMQKSLRISLTHAKRRAPMEMEQARRQMDAQRRELEKHCASMGPDACRDMKQAFAAGDEAVRESHALWALFPEPSPAEAALLAEYDARLQAVMEDEDRAGGEEGDGVDPGAEGDDAPADGADRE